MYVTSHILWYTKYNPRWWLIKWNGMSVVDCHYEDYSTGRQRQHQAGRHSLEFAQNVKLFHKDIWQIGNANVVRPCVPCQSLARDDFYSAVERIVSNRISSSFLFSPLHFFVTARARDRQRRESITFRRSCTSAADRSALTCKCASKGGEGGGGTESEGDIGSLFLHPSRYRPPIITTQH